MLESLSIKNIAIIDSLEIDFKGGLNVMTGETGAGKTIIVQALMLVLGGRASSEYIRAGESEASVAAVFKIENGDSKCRGPIQNILDNNGIEYADGQVIIRRVISGQGKGKITINGVPVTLAMLKDIAEHLVDISSQHEHQLLLDPANHYAIIDEFGVPKDVRARYSDAYSSYSSVRNELQKMRDEGRGAKERLDFLKFQLDEIEAAAPIPGEIEELEVKRARLKNAVMLESAARESANILYESTGSVTEMLDRVALVLRTASDVDPELKVHGDATLRAQAELAEAARELKRYYEKLGAEPMEMEALEDRLHLLRGLARKHGGSLDDAIRKMETISDEINRAENYDDVLAKCEEKFQGLRAKLKKAAAELTKARKEAAVRLAKFVQEELAGLAMGKVKFSANIEPKEEDQFDATGPDRIEFFISPNIGEDLRPLARTASGGELSRIMLAIKRALAEKAGLAATYVFDEVDSGIGGATADAVGRKLFEVARARQVICITHLPQVACFGDSHYTISKRVEKGRTRAEIVLLGESDRVDEIARMLGGATITDVTKKHAKEMLSKAVNREQ